MKKNVLTFNIALITALICAVSFTHPLYASTTDLDQAIVDNSGTPSDESGLNTLTNTVAPIFSALTEAFIPQQAPATTSPATTTPAASASTTSPTSVEVKTGDPINPRVETILNTVIPPKPAPTKVTRPSATTSATSTPVAGSTKPKNTTGTTNSTPEVTETFERTTNGESNAITPANYYTPLDNLTPESTYALSFVAMILGIMGAVLILKEPSESPAWMPGLKTQESLLDS